MEQQHTFCRYYFVGWVRFGCIAGHYHNYLHSILIMRHGYYNCGVNSNQHLDISIDSSRILQRKLCRVANGSYLLYLDPCHWPVLHSMHQSLYQPNIDHHLYCDRYWQLRHFNSYCYRVGQSHIGAYCFQWFHTIDTNSRAAESSAIVLGSKLSPCALQALVSSVNAAAPVVEFTAKRRTRCSRRTR